MLRLRFGPKAPGEARVQGVQLPEGLSRGPQPSGRGVHVHAQQACLEQAARKGLARGLRRPVRLAPGELVGRVRAALAASVTAGFQAARRQGHLVRVENVTDAPHLRVYATDAPVMGATPEGVRLGTRRQLGALVGQREVDVVALRHAGLASRVQRAYALGSASGVGGLEVG